MVPARLRVREDHRRKAVEVPPDPARRRQREQQPEGTRGCLHHEGSSHDVTTPVLELGPLKVYHDPTRKYVVEQTAQKRDSRGWADVFHVRDTEGVDLTLHLRE